MKVTWLQLPSLGNVQDNFQNIQDVLNHLESKNKADLIVLPELCLWDYFCITEDSSHFDDAITLDSPIIVNLSKTAKAINSLIVFPFFEKRSEGIYHNSVIVIERDGSIAGLYRKMHIPDDPGFY